MCIFSSVCSRKLQRAALVTSAPRNVWLDFTCPSDHAWLFTYFQMPHSHRLIHDELHFHCLTDGTNKVADKSSVYMADS